jgi:hypothetical protein
MWGTQPIPAVYINSTHIACNSTNGVGAVNVSVSENGQQYSKPLLFSFVRKLILFGLFGLFVLFVFVIQQMVLVL